MGWGEWLEYDMAIVGMKLVSMGNVSDLEGMRGVEVREHAVFTDVVLIL